MSVHSQAGNISSSVDHNVGWHFTLSSRIAYNRPPGCETLHVDCTLPHGIFVDPYELDLRSESYTYSIDTVPDLERPASAVPAQSTALRLHVAPPLIEKEGMVELALPLHARYGNPSSEVREEAYMAVHLPPPTAFWSCSHPAMVPLMIASPVKAIPLLAPVGLSDDLQSVEVGTAFSVLVVFSYLAYTFYKVHSRVINHLHQSKEE